MSAKPFEVGMQEPFTTSSLETHIREFSKLPWGQQVDNLHRTRQTVLTESGRDVIMGNLRKFILSILTSVSNLRSVVSTSGLECISDVFSNMGRKLDSEIHVCIPPLMQKYMDGNKFIREQVNNALDTITDVSSARKLLPSLIANMDSRKSPMQGKISSMMLRSLEMGAAGVIKDRKLLDNLLPALVQLLNDKSSEARGCAGRCLAGLRVMLTAATFEPWVKQSVKASEVAQVLKISDDLESEVLDEKGLFSHSTLESAWTGGKDSPFRSRNDSSTPLPRNPSSRRANTRNQTSYTPTASRGSPSVRLSGRNTPSSRRESPSVSRRRPNATSSATSPVNSSSASSKKQWLSSTPDGSANTSRNPTFSRGRGEISRSQTANAPSSSTNNHDNMSTPNRRRLAPRKIKTDSPAESNYKPTPLSINDRNSASSMTSPTKGYLELHGRDSNNNDTPSRNSTSRTSMNKTPTRNTYGSYRKNSYDENAEDDDYDEDDDDCYSDDLFEDYVDTDKLRILRAKKHRFRQRARAAKAAAAHGSTSPSNANYSRNSSTGYRDSTDSTWDHRRRDSLDGSGGGYGGDEENSYEPSRGESRSKRLISANSSRSTPALHRLNAKLALANGSPASQSSNASMASPTKRSEDLNCNSPSYGPFSAENGGLGSLDEVAQYGRRSNRSRGRGGGGGDFHLGPSAVLNSFDPMSSPRKPVSTGPDTPDWLPSPTYSREPR